MHITVCGEGYSGLVVSVSLCELGHTVYGFDSNIDIVKNLNLGKISASFADPWIIKYIQAHLKSKTLQFSSDLNALLKNTDVIIISIPVKGQESEDINLDPLMNIINIIASNLSRNRYIPILLQTSVPVGTNSILFKSIQNIRPDLTPGIHYDFINNPIFIREGTGIKDFIFPDRVVFGSQNYSDLSLAIIDDLYKTIKKNNIPFIYTNFETAELIKSVSMSFATIKMAFTNEIEQLCRNTSIDFNALIKGLSTDRRISSDSLMFNAGVGGSSLPRTARLLIKSAKTLGVDLSILETALNSNSKRINRIYNRILAFCDSKSKIIKKVTVFGLSFKPLTDDFRESPSLYIIRQLLNSGINVSLYDPYYSSNNLYKIPNYLISNSKFKAYKSPYEAVAQSDAVIIMTNWPEFAKLDMGKIADLMNSKPILFDCFNKFSKFNKYFNYVAA